MRFKQVLLAEICTEGNGNRPYFNEELIERLHESLN